MHFLPGSKKRRGRNDPPMSLSDAARMAGNKTKRLYGQEIFEYNGALGGAKSKNWIKRGLELEAEERERQQGAAPTES